jgi:hypothetical protein
MTGTEWGAAAMSEIRGGLLTALAQGINDPIEHHRRQPPDKQALAQVSLAAHLLGWCLYLCPLIKTGPFPLAVLLGVSYFGNGHAPDWWLPEGSWAGLTMLGLLWLLSAWRQARLYARRELGTAFGRLVLAVIFAGLLWYHVYPDDWPAVALILKGFYIAWGLSHALRFIFAAQLFGGGSAERTIRRIVKRRGAPMIPARKQRVR